MDQVQMSKGLEMIEEMVKDILEKGGEELTAKDIASLISYGMYRINAPMETALIGVTVALVTGARESGMPLDALIGAFENVATDIYSQLDNAETNLQ